LHISQSIFNFVVITLKIQSTSFSLFVNQECQGQYDLF
jgi:hypothetical protein